MNNFPDHKEFELLYVIVEDGLGSKVLSFAKHNGISGGTVLLGKGTTQNYLLELFSIEDTRREIVLLLTEKSIARGFLPALNKEIKFCKPRRGIAFGVAVTGICGTQSCNNIMIKKSEGEDIMYQSIFVIVDKGKAEAVIEAAAKVGSKGGTIINARGSGIHETSKFFSIEIEPEKELALIISEKPKTIEIIDSIRDSLNIDAPGNGIILVQDVTQAYGL